MKIIHSKKINASSEIKFAKIPAPFDKYYKLMSDEEFEDEYMYPAHPSPIEEVQDYTGAYDVKPLWYVIARPEYADALGDSGLDCLELVREGDTDFLAYTIHDRIYRLDESELNRALGSAWSDDDDDDEDPWEDDDEDGKDWYDEIDSCNQIQGAVDTGLEYWYYTPHGLGPGMMPRGVDILDTYEEGYKTWFKSNKMLTTEELNEYEIREMYPPEGAVTRNGDVIEACSVTAAECTKVSEDSDSIHYVISSEEVDDFEDIEAMSLVNYKNYKIRSNPKLGGYDVIDPDGHVVDTGCLTERSARALIDSIEASTDISGAIDDEEFFEDEYLDEEFEEAPEQEYSSAGTAINGKQGKLPAVFKKANIPSGAHVLDYGGGTVESEQVAQAYLDQFGAIEMLYDPFNQTPEHNSEVIKTLRQIGGADAAICSNVLNVIKEPEVRFDVLKKIKNLMRPGAIAYISVYEGSKNGEGSDTQNGQSYQNNMKLADYLDEIQEVFPEATRKGAVILAPKTAGSKVAASINVDDFSIKDLTEELDQARHEFMMFPEIGFLEDEADQYSFLEITEEPQDNRIKVEVRAEISYESMMEFANYMDNIIEKYDPDAYFDMEAPGIMTAYMYFDNEYNDLTAATDIRAAHPDFQSSRSKSLESYNKEKMSAEERRQLDPDDYYEDESGSALPEDIEIDFNFDFPISVDENGDWQSLDGSEVDNAEDLEDEGLDREVVKEYFDDLVAWHIPTKSGQYRVKGHARMVFTAKYPSSTSSKDYVWGIASNGTNIDEIEVIKTGKLESSTDVTASDTAMTEAELNYAIENGKPFTLDAFKKYKVSKDSTFLTASEVEVGDIISIDADASEVNLGTVIKVTAVNDENAPNYDDYFDYSITGEVVEDPGGQHLKKGEIVTLHFDGDEEVGTLIPV